MTGFGAVSEQVDGILYAVELRSLNNRYFKATIRLPEDVAGLEAELESSLRKRVSRGSLTLTVKLRLADAGAAGEVNDAALLAYLDHLETIHAKFANQDRSVNIDLTALLALPGVLQPSESAQTLVDRARPVLLKLTQTACQRMTAMRDTEGQATAEDLLSHARQMRERLDAVAQRAPLVVEEYHQRLTARIDELLARAALKVDERDLIKEVAVFAERSDISEELTRLRGHLEQFEQAVESPQSEPVGRTLEFIAQEMLREANTIASKSNDTQISRAIVEVKGSIDRIKEQAQNVE
jgi:uncharacterized protein (TIGR00255 family)